ncbi:MAG: transposase [Rhodoferax sp.]
MNTSIIELPARRSRRRHPAEFKRRIVQACQQGGISIAAVALANRLNANMVRKWVIEAEGTQPPGRPSAAKRTTAVSERSRHDGVPAPGFIPIPTAIGAAEACISVEIHRGPTVVKLTWPTAAAAECAAWLRDLLR